MNNSGRIKYFEANKIIVARPILVISVFIFTIFLLTQFAFAQSVGVVTLYGTVNVADNRLDQKQTIQLYTTTPLDVTKKLAFQFLDSVTDRWRVIGSVKSVSSYTSVGSAIRKMDFTPNLVGINRGGYGYKFRAIVGSSFVANGVEDEGVSGSIDKTYVMDGTKSFQAPPSLACRENPTLDVVPIGTNIITYERDDKPSGTLKYSVLVKNNDKCVETVDLTLGFRLEVSYVNSPFTAELSTEGSGSVCSSTSNCIVSDDQNAIRNIPLSSADKSPTKFTLEVTLPSSTQRTGTIYPVGLTLTNVKAATYKATKTVPVIISVTERECRDDASNDEDESAVSLQVTGTGISVSPGQSITYKGTLVNTNEGGCTDTNNKFTFLGNVPGGGVYTGVDQLYSRPTEFRRSVQGLDTLTFVVPSTPAIGQTGTNKKEFTAVVDTLLETQPGNYRVKFCFLKSFNGKLLCGDAPISVAVRGDTNPPTIESVTTVPEFPTLFNLNSLVLKIRVSDDVKLKQLRFFTPSSATTESVASPLSEPQPQDVEIKHSDLSSIGKPFKEGDNSYKIELEDASGKVTTKTGTVKVQSAANMHVNSITFGEENPTIGEEFDVAVRVGNDGDVQVSESKVELYVDGKVVDTNSKTCATRSCANKHDFKVKISTSGQREIKANVVVTGINDANPTDNSKTQKITILETAAPGASIGTDQEGNVLQVGTDKESYKRGETISVSGTVKSGSTVVSGASVQIEILQPDGRSLGKFTGILTDPSGKFSYPVFLSPGTATGNWKFIATYKTVTADKSVSVAEDGTVPALTPGETPPVQTVSQGGYKATLGFDKSTYNKGEYVTYSGTLTTDADVPVYNAIIDIEIYRKVGGTESFVLKASPKTTDTSGKFSGLIFIDATTDAEGFKVVAKYPEKSVSIDSSFTVGAGVAAPSGNLPASYPEVKTVADGVSITTGGKDAYKIGDYIPITIGTFSGGKPLANAKVTAIFKNEDRADTTVILTSNSDGKIVIPAFLNSKVKEISVSLQKDSQTYTDKVDITTQ